MTRADYQRLGRQAAGQPLPAIPDVAGGELVEAVLGVIVAHDLDADQWSWPSQQRIAGLLEVTRETVNRVIMALTKLAGRVLLKILPKRYGRWPHAKYLVFGRRRVHLFRKGVLGIPHTEGTAKALTGSQQAIRGAKRADVRVAAPTRAGPVATPLDLEADENHLERMRQLLTARNYPAETVEAIVNARREMR